MQATRKPADSRDPPHAGKPILESFDLAVEGKRPVEHAHRVQRLLKGAGGVRRIGLRLDAGRVTITYDARRTNPAAIHELLLQRGYRAAARAE